MTIKLKEITGFDLHDYYDQANHELHSNLMFKGFDKSGKLVVFEDMDENLSSFPPESLIPLRQIEIFTNKEPTKPYYADHLDFLDTRDASSLEELLF